MRQFLLSLALLLASAPAIAAAPPVAEHTLSVEAMDSELTAYGEWLGQAGRIQMQLQAQLGTLQSAWQEVAASRDRRAAGERFRSHIAQIMATIDQTNVQLAALDTPEFPALELEEDLRPAAIVRDTLRLNRGLRDAIDTFNALTDAFVRNDGNAAVSAGARMMAALRLVMESQVVLTRASLAATPREESAWEMGNIQLVFFRSADRILAAWPQNGVSGRDPALSADLLTLANELDATADRGSEKVDADIARFSAMLGEAERDGDASLASIMRRAVAVLTVTKAVFPLGRELAGILRESAMAFRSGAITLPAMAAAFRRFPAIRARFDAIALEESAALARAN